MPERDNRDSSPTPGEDRENTGEERLRSLFTTAYLPLEPSEALRQRVAAAAAERETPAARRHRSWPAPLGWGAAFGAAAAVLLAVLALALVGGHHGGARSIPSMAVNSRPALRTPERLAQAPPPRPLAPVPEGAASASEGLAGADGPFGVRQRAAALAPSGHEKSGDDSARRAGLGHEYQEAGRYPGPAQKRQHAAALQKGGSRILRPLFPKRSLQSPPSPSIGGGGQGVGARTSRDDLAFLNADPERVARQWAPLPREDWEQIEARVRRSVKVKDDFVRIPFARLASTSGRQIVAAVEEYKKQAAVVDARLAREVTLACKGMALSDLCDLLHSQTGLAITAGRSVADEKVTVFCEKLPLRQVMRAINHLFGDTWLRSGKPGEFKYELEQDLRSQLLEEELRNRDRDATLLALDAQVQQYRPYLEMSFDALEQQATQSPQVNRLLFGIMHDAGWAGMQIYHRLTASQRAALIAGQTLAFRPDAADPDLRLPAEWQRPILRSWDNHIRVAGKLTPMSDVPGMKASVVWLKLNRTELGQVSLTCGVTADSPGPSGDATSQTYFDVATGRSPSLASPENGKANAPLRGQSPFDRIISLRPKPSCTRLKQGKVRAWESRLYRASLGDMGQPHVFSGDVWEAVHQATGLPIVADYFTRMHRLDKVTVERKSLYEALCTAADAMGVRWRKDGDFLLCRSTSYFWDKLKEVPNRYLQRWSRDRDANGSLPLADFLEMASRPDQELDSRLEAEAIAHCWELPEWTRLFPGQREWARLLSVLTPEQLQQVQQPDGLPFSMLTPAQQQQAMQIQWHLNSEGALKLGEPALTGWGAGMDQNRWMPVLHAVYAPAGWYVWAPPVGSSTPRMPRVLFPTSGRTPAEALAAIRRAWPQAPQGVVTQADGPPRVGSPGVGSWGSGTQQAEDGYFSAGIDRVLRSSARLGSAGEAATPGRLPAAAAAPR